MRPEEPPGMPGCRVPGSCPPPPVPLFERSGFNPAATATLSLPAPTRERGEAMKMESVREGNWVLERSV